MKRIKEIVVVVSLILISVSDSIGQIKLKSMVAFNYSYGIPVGSLNAYIPDKPFHGVNGDYRYFYKRELSFGFHIGWNSFKEVFPRQTFETDKGTVSAVQTKFFYSFPILFTTYYYLRSNKHIMPYFGGGLGPVVTNYDKWYSVVNFRSRGISFGIAPEVGVIIPFKNSGFGLNFSGRYNNVFYSHEEVANLRYFEINAGIYVGYF